MAGSENGPVVTAGNAADSKLVELIVNQKMPKRGPKLTPPQVQLITEWVNQGALNNNFVHRKSIELLKTWLAMREPLLISGIIFPLDNGEVA